MKILLTLLNIFSPSILIASTSTTLIKSCYDGDTCTTSKGEKIRLACIDSPELKGDKANPIPAKKTRDFLNNLIANKQVFIRRITFDKYRRTVAELYKDEINIQKLLVDKNLAKIYKKYSYQCPWIN